MPANIHHKLLQDKIINLLTDSSPLTMLEIITDLNKYDRPFDVIRNVDVLKASGIVITHWNKKNYVLKYSLKG